MGPWWHRLSKQQCDAGELDFGLLEPLPLSKRNQLLLGKCNICFCAITFSEIHSGDVNKWPSACPRSSCTIEARIVSDFRQGSPCQR